MSGERSSPSDQSAEPYAVVGIGASAGGLAALKALFSEVSPDSGFAYVVVMHLSPEHESQLAGVLQPHCRIPATQVTEPVRIERDHIYIIPPNANLEQIDTHLRLAKLEDQVSKRRTIDHFFRTLSDSTATASVGVLLSGTGSDGTLGLREIKASGGLTVAQDPNEAEYDAMPRSAIAAGVVDFVRPSRAIPTLLTTLRGAVAAPVHQSDDDSLSDADRDALQRILRQVGTRTGHSFSDYKTSTVLRRINRRMRLLQVESLEAYLGELERRQDEPALLLDDLLLTVTQFFRDGEVFQELQECLRELIKTKQPRDTLRVWSVGCSTGEEAYSLGMLLLEESEGRGDDLRIQIFATDLHESSLNVARVGRYPEGIVDDLSPERLQRFFVEESSTYLVSQRLRELIVFSPHNLLQDPPFSQLDLIVCRNLMIYLQRDIQQEVFGLFHYALKPEGLLVLGSSESLDSRLDLFMAERKSHNIYRRRGVPTRELKLPTFLASRRGAIPHRTSAVDHPRRAQSYGLVHEQVVERYAPPSVLIDPNNDIVHYSAGAGRFLRQPGGEPTGNILKLVREPLRVELLAALHAAARSEGPVSPRPVRWLADGEEETVLVRVRPATEPELRGFVLVIFDDLEGSAQARAVEGPSADPIVAELESELEATRSSWQATIEEYETSQEEMMASNEELQSANEELRSTMEELETSREELQSMNEELVTLNQENRHRVEELSEVTGDLRNLLAVSDVATLFLDRDLRIVRFTPHVADLFSILASDRGRPLADLTHRLGESDLNERARRILADLIPQEVEIRAEDGRYYILRLVPYRTADDRIDGVVITFVDVTRLKETEGALRRLATSLGQRVKERTTTLERLNERLRLLVSELTTSEHKERHGLARTLHDHLQQLLVGAQLQLRPTDVEADPESERPRAARAIELLDQAISATRALAVQIRPPALYEEGFIAALRRLATWMKETHDLDVELRLEPFAEPTLESGAPVMFEAVRELLLNVVKHAGVKSCVVELTKVEWDTVSVTVSDAGIGFDPAEVRSRTDDSGLGLAHTRSRVALLGGELSIDSSPGSTTVRLVVPIGRSEPAVDAPDAASDEDVDSELVDSAEIGVIRVLVADDHIVVREGIANIINQAPDMLVVGEASDGEMAVSIARTLRPNVVVLDVSMPGMDGIAAARAITTELPEVGVIGLSISNDEATVRSMLDAGASAYVTKDAPFDELRSAIRRCFKAQATG